MDRLRYSTIEDALREAFEIPPSATTALKGRIKHMQRMGFPIGPRGSGNREGYSFDEFLDVVLAFALADVGLAPTRAVRIVRANRDAVRSAVARATAGEAPYLAIGPRALRGLAAGKSDDEGGDDGIVVLTAAELVALLSNRGKLTPSSNLVDTQWILIDTGPLVDFAIRVATRAGATVARERVHPAT